MTLDYVESGVDTGETHTLTIQPKHGTCVVSDVAQGYTANGGAMTFPARSYACASIARRDGGLLIVGCGAEGDIFVPGPTATPPAMGRV
jgi:hypothetical protein